MPADLADLKRRRRQAARTLLADSKPVEAGRDSEAETGEIGVVLASPDHRPIVFLNYAVRE